MLTEKGDSLKILARVTRMILWQEAGTDLPVKQDISCQTGTRTKTIASILSINGNWDVCED